MLEPSDPQTFFSGNTPAVRKNRAEHLRRPSLVINALSNWAGLGVNVVVGFLLTPYVVAQLGQSGYGIWTLVGSIIGYYGLLDLGVGSAVSRYIARYAARQDHQSLNETFNTALVAFCLVGLLILGTAYWVATPVAHFFSVSPDYLVHFRNAMWLLSLSAAVNMVGQVFRAMIRAYEHFVIRNCIIITTTLLRAGLAVWLLSRGLGLVAVAVSYLLADVVTLIAGVVLCRRLAPQIQIATRFLNWRVIRTLLSFGLPSTVIVVASIIANNLDSAVIGKMISLEAVAIYGVAAVLMRYFMNLINSGMGVLTPRFAGLDGIGDSSRFRLLLIKALWVSSLLSCFMGMLFLILGEPFILRWIGNQYQEAALVLSILAISGAISQSQTPSNYALFAMNKHRFLGVVTMIGACCNLGLSIWLAPKIGIVGVAIGTLIPNVIIKVVLQPIFVARVAGIRLWSYLCPTLISAVAATIIFVAWNEFETISAATELGYFDLLLLSACLAGLYTTLILIGSVIFTLFTDRRLGLPLRHFAAARSSHPSEVTPISQLRRTSTS